jgi:hypothetical protein
VGIIALVMGFKGGDVSIITGFTVLFLFLILFWCCRSGWIFVEFLPICQLAK